MMMLLKPQRNGCNNVPVPPSPLTVQDALGNTKTYTYDTKGNVLSVTDEAGNTTSYTYDFKKRVTSKTDAKGIVTRYTYDGEGNLTEIKEALSTAAERLTKITYDVLNRKETITDPMNNVTKYEYQGSTTGCATCKGGSTEIPAKITDPLGNVTQLTFDENGKVIGIKDPLNNQTTIMYNAVGQVTARTDANNNITKYEYDANGRVTKQTDANSGDIIFTYDSRGNLKTLTDQNNNTTTFEYDKADRKIKEIRPMAQAIEYSYYPNGLLKTVKDAKAQVTTYIYDTANHLSEIDYADAKKDTFAYDAVGNMISYINSSVTDTITYDSLNRKTSETVNYGTFSKTYSYTYNVTGNKASYKSPEGVPYAYTYNKNNQLLSMAFANKTINYEQEWQRQKKTTLPNGVTMDYGYNAASWLMDIMTKISATTLANSHYIFDPVGNITGKTTEQGSHSYGYDPLYQLTQATHPALPTEAYSYDNVGNRQTSTSGATTMSYGHNANNELLSFGTTTVGYDPNGNTTQTTNGSDITAYIYNAKDKMERVDLPDGSTAVYRYDPFGRRVSKTVNSITTYYLYADEGLIGEYSLSGAMQKTYGWMPDSIWGTNPVFMVSNNQYYYYANDDLGTPQKMTDGNGNVVWSATYTAFGEAVIDPSSTVTNNLRFPGQYFDDETGLHYNWNRYYDPKTGRYMQTDPLGYLADIHLYRYVGNNSANRRDPLGLFGDGKNSGQPLTAEDYAYSLGNGNVPLGHSDFTGNSSFDYTREDYGTTSPYRNPERHFRDLSTSEADVSAAIASFDKDAFERAMHRGQDYFSHYDKGYRWKPGDANLPCRGYGHACDGTSPDDDNAAWDKAEAWTKLWIKKWNEKNDCKE